MPGQASDRWRPRLAAAGVALTALVLAAALSLGSQPEQATGQAAQAPPNIVVLLTDDQEPASIRVMKTLAKEMKRKGVTMKRFYDNFPLCCPSRATLLTGQYAHNHQVLSNSAPEGGYGVFNERHGNNNLPIWLQQAGYTTGYIGKFLNEYAEPDEYGTLPRDVPEGWNDWRVLAPSNAQYFGYTLNQNGALTEFGEEEDDYSTDVFTTKAKRFIRRNAPSPNPFFLMLGYAAPHGGGGGSPGRSCNRGAVPAPRHLGMLRDNQKGNLPPSFNEGDVSDKPSPIAEDPPLTPGQINDTLRKRRCAWESLLAVDESVGEIVDEVKRVGERGRTYVFFLSDNGYLRGEHRIRNNKRFLYEESVRVPFVVRGPGVARGESSADVVTNADLVPTLLEISGATPGSVQDGQSLLPSFATPKNENGRTILLEAYAGDEIIGLRNSRFLYTEWDTNRVEPERELYDTYSDPNQLDNLVADPAYAGVVNDLRAQLADLIDCAGADCRAQPAGELVLERAGNGKGGCAIPPVGARLELSDAGRVSSVEFRVDQVTVGGATAPPFELALPEKALRAALPDAAAVIARASYVDGRRLARTVNIKVCK